MGEELASKVLITFILLIIAGLVLLFMWLIFKDAAGIASEQKAFANAEKLKSAIEEACYRNVDSNKPIKVDLELPQELPANARWGAFAEDFVGSTWIKSMRYGDPQFVVYYEMFPPGEGSSWEIHNEFGYRVIAMLPTGMNTIPSDFIEQVKEKAIDRLIEEGEEIGDKPIDVVIGNVKLSEDFDPATGGSPEESAGAERFFDLGEWDHDNFLFANYFELPALEKSFLKYQPCGDNKFCVKTSKGIFTYDLDYCKESGIDYIQFVGGYSWKFPTPFQKEEVWDRHSDFYFVSPCEVTSAEVYIDDCTENADISNYPNAGKCEKNVTHPMYEYDRINGLQNIGDHTFCLDYMDGNDKNQLSDAEELKCVRVYFSDKEGHCFSYNEALGQNLITDAVEYVSENGYEFYILKPIDTVVWWDIAGEMVLGEENPVWP